MTSPQPVHEPVDRPGFVHATCATPLVAIEHDHHTTWACPHCGIPVAATYQPRRPTIIRGESEPIGPAHVERGPVRQALHEVKCMGLMTLAIVLCCGGVALPFVLAGLWFGALDDTTLGVLLFAAGIVLAFSLGIALVQPCLDWLTRRLHVDW